MKNTKGHICLSHTEKSCKEAISGLTKMLTDQLDPSRGGSSKLHFFVSLVDMLLKLCLIIVKSSDPESLLAEWRSREGGTGPVGSEDVGTADSTSEIQ